MSSENRLLQNIPFFSCIFARDFTNGGIGFQNSLPWAFEEDMKHFRNITTNNTENKENIVIMGRNTWESIKKPLPKRINIVVTSQKVSYDGAHTSSSLDDALKLSLTFGKGRIIFVIGGSRLFKESFKHPHLESIYETNVVIYPYVKYDVYFNDKIPSNFDNVYHSESNSTNKNCTTILTFNKFNKIIKSPEQSYINLVKEILETGEERGDRTGTGTVSIFGSQIEFDIKDQFPLLTTKNVGLKTVFEELIWMLRGQTNNNTLKRKKVNIWTKNSEDHHKRMIQNGVSHAEGDLGPIYGYQWRSFGGDYKPISNYYGETLSDRVNDIVTESELIKLEDKYHIGEGFDQIKFVINEIKKNPESRRILFSGWNPQVLNDVCLPSCHFACQFYTSQKKYLHCKLSMRSNDVFLGAPFNIAQYSLLTYMIASMTGYIPGKLIYSIGDAHIYLNHIEQMKIQIDRPLRNLPTLKVIKTHDKIEDFEFTDFELSGYNPHPSIRGDMAV